MYAFVYGTLRRGDSRFGVLDGCECMAEEAYLDDFEMLSLGSFPGIVARTHGSGRVRGEVYKIDETILSRLDNIEGYHEDDPVHSLYLRKEITAVFEDGNNVLDPEIDDAPIFTYVFNIDRAQDRGYKVIESGDWFDESPPRQSRKT
jgi:gamma-glutamylcyclotransferase (GGCT)/AIG2-like uncharacterized protein YtfP